jgi:hypothetical protein
MDHPRGSGGHPEDEIDIVHGNTFKNAEGSMTHIPPNWEWEKWGTAYNQGTYNNRGPGRNTMAGFNYDKIGLYKNNTRRTSGYLTNDPRNRAKKEKI